VAAVVDLLLDVVDLRSVGVPHASNGWSIVHV
jgi:hypothetical protein